MPPDQVYNWVQQLPPELQASMMQYLYGMGMGQFPVNPYDGITPGVAYGYTPEMDKKGNVQPFDLTVARNNLNYVQDAQGTTIDPVFQAMGPPEQWARDAFTPTPVYNPYDERSMNLFDRYSQMDPLKSMEGFIANLMREPNNMSASQAYAEFISAAQVDPDLATQIPSTPIFDQYSGEITGEKPNPQAIYEFATDLERDIGSVTEPQMQQTAMGKWYKDQGLPLPTEQYGQGNYDPNLYRAPGAEQNFTAANDALTSARNTQQKKSAEADRLIAQRDKVANWEPGDFTGQWLQELANRSKPQPPPQQKPFSPADDASISMYTTPMEMMPDDVQKRMGTAVDNRRQPTSSFDRRRPGGSGDLTTKASRIRRSGDRGVEDAKKSRRLAYMEAYLNPDYVYEKNRMAGYQKAGRTPTQDAMMARQITNYLLGVYGPRG